MAMSKKRLKEMLCTIPPARLQNIARRNFTRMTGPYTHEDYAERLATPSRATTVVSELKLAELLLVASFMGIDAAGMAPDHLMSAILEKINGTQLSPTESGATIFEAISTNSDLEKLYERLLRRASVHSTTPMTTGETLALAALQVAFVGTRVRFVDAFELFVRIHASWPEPTLSALRLVGATRTADWLVELLQSLIPSATNEWTGNQLFATLLKIPSSRHSNSVTRKEWKSGWLATGEDVEQLAKAYLSAHPELFE
ncbi:MAG: hypothetical protein ACRCZF_21035 [Gemmataceae bacterium]